MGCLLQLLAINADGATGLGTAVKVLHFGNVDFEPVFTEPAVPLWCLPRGLCALHCIHEGNIVNVEMHPGVWSLEVSSHRVYTEDEQQGGEGDPWWIPTVMLKGGDNPARHLTMLKVF